MKTLRNSIAAYLLVLSSVVGVAQAGDLTLHYGPDMVYNRDGTYHVFSQDPLNTYLRLTLGYEFMENLSAHIEYWYGEERDYLFGFDSFSFETESVGLSVEYGYKLFSFFRPHARAGVGLVWGILDIQSSGVAYRDIDLGMRIFALAGYELLLPLGNPHASDAGFWDRISLGLRNEYGWSFGPWYRFDELAVKDAPEGSPVIDLGDATLGGFNWNLGLTVRYLL